MNADIYKAHHPTTRMNNAKLYELYFLDQSAPGKKFWLYWKKYKTEADAFSAAKALLRRLFSDCEMAKIRDLSTGNESFYSA